MQRRIRDARRRQGYLMDAVRRWTQGRDEHVILEPLYWYKQHMSPSPLSIAALQTELEDHIYTILWTRYEKRFHINIPASQVIESIEQDIYDDAKLDMVEWRLLSALDAWAAKYNPNESALKKLAKDKQNVHTGVVNKQIDDANKILNAIIVPKNQHTLDEIYDAWTQVLPLTWIQINPVYFDMLYWGKKKRIYKSGDYLYRKMLQKLWALIKSYMNSSQDPSANIYKELLTRLWEECQDSLNMCAHGHISRLTNVMVGFHDGFLSPQSSATAFQNAIASISNKNMLVSEKIAQASALMTTYGIPEDERQVWLDAF